MSVEMMHQISCCCYVAAGVLSFVEMVLFFHFNIWKLLGDFTGMNKKRELKAIYEKEQIVQGNEDEIFGIKEEKHLWTAKITFKEETGLLEEGQMSSQFVLVEELGFVESQQWLE